MKRERSEDYEAKLNQIKEIVRGMDPLLGLLLITELYFELKKTASILTDAAELQLKEESL